ncbi:hypothetical protein NSA47_03040 [Irregularibacter muris]|uniref:Apea-like HEPN domain-containing protein n=1 Tax=Irregularibacter muris TaxID=1796619 RepID=A0AAE3L3B3_9FIRM|nr:hypothetical protein [Irregularibacter muris]MCR1897963.1 hypothetical protein [Irregularibacter muris]
MSKWKLYWVASDGLEDCFVVAKNSRSAGRIEKDTNGFIDEDIEVTRIMDVPDEYEEIANKKFRKWSKEQKYNEHLDIDTLIAWPYYGEEWLLEKLGVEYRTIEEEQILINDFVITSSHIYSVGLKAMKEVYELTGEKSIDISNVNYEEMRESIEHMLGVCMTTIHRIENYITSSFIFAVGNKKYGNYTINEATQLWRDKLTFGKLIQLIEERYEINEDVRKSLILFLTQRNKIAHGLTKDERYDIDTIWGQKETAGYLALFLKNAWILEDIFESAYITTMCIGFHLMKDATENPELLKTIRNFKNDPIIAERISIFAEVFKIKDDS